MRNQFVIDFTSGAFTSHFCKTAADICFWNDPTSHQNNLPAVGREGCCAQRCFEGWDRFLHSGSECCRSREPGQQPCSRDHRETPEQQLQLTPTAPAALNAFSSPKPGQGAPCAAHSALFPARRHQPEVRTPQPFGVPGWKDVFGTRRVSLANAAFAVATVHNGLGTSCNASMASPPQDTGTLFVLCSLKAYLKASLISVAQNKKPIFNQCLT